MAIRLAPSIDNYGVMGAPIAHSLSPQIHAAFAAQCGHELHYQAILVEHGQFKKTVMEFRMQGGKGLNITLPFKNEAWRIADHTSVHAQCAKAVNTIHFDDSNRIIGDNTDGIGWVRDVTQNHGLSIKGRRFLLLGAGGAICGLLKPLLDEQPANVMIVNRTLARARALANRFARQDNLSVSGFEAVPPIDEVDLIVNGTSASLQDALPPLPYTDLTDVCCYDLAYAKTSTRFVKWAVACGAEVALDGMGMLVEQAAESYRIWHGVRPQTTEVIQSFRVS